MSAVQPCPWLFSKVINLSRNWHGILGNPSCVTCHVSLQFLFQIVCNIDKVISVSLRCCHARYVCPTFSSLTLTLSMSSLLSLVHTHPPGPDQHMRCSDQHSTLQFPPAHHRPQTQKKNLETNQNGFLPRLGWLSVWRWVYKPCRQWPFRYKFAVSRGVYHSHTEGKKHVLLHYYNVSVHYS